jgi:hypothetical protein
MSAHVMPWYVISLSYDWSISLGDNKISAAGCRYFAACLSTCSLIELDGIYLKFHRDVLLLPDSLTLGDNSAILKHLRKRDDVPSLIECGSMEVISTEFIVFSPVSLTNICICRCPLLAS